MDTQTGSSFALPRTPLLRNVEAFPIEHDGQQGYCLRDPQRIATNTLILPPAAFFIASFFNGNSSIEDIAEECTRQFQQPISTQDIESIVSRLDDELFLESEQFQHAVSVLEREYFDAPLRPAFHAGGAYEGDAPVLEKRLESLLGSIDATDDPLPADAQTLTGLVSPHIDMHRGGAGFAYAYRELKNQPPADVYVIFGTGHQCRHSLMIPTRKSYDTPLGAVPTNIELIDSFAAKTSLQLFDEEILHRDEHSVEFQAVWLRYILGPKWKGSVVPILTGSLHQFIQEGRSPRTEAIVSDSLDALRECISDIEGTVMVIAGADMSHVGKRFGHEKGIPESELERVNNEDNEILEAMRSGDAEAYFSSIEKQKDRNHVCGLSPVYMTLDIVRPQTGRILNYDRAIEEDTESVVTYSSAAFYD